MCSAKDSRAFWRYTKDTHRAGFFTPTINDGKLDRQTIQKLLPRVREKKQWISGNIEKVSRLKNLDMMTSKFKALQDDLRVLVGFKRKFYEEKNLKQKKAISKLSNRKLQNFFSKLRSKFG